MITEFYEKWEYILQDVEKSKIPLEFIKKVIVKLKGKKQHTINIQKLLERKASPEEIEDIVSEKLYELDPIIVDIEFILNLQSIANTVQPETDKILHKLNS